MSSVPVLVPVAYERGLRWRMIAFGERAVAAILFVAALPVILSSAAVIRMVSGRSPWIAHKRVGWQGAPLWMWKLRTMWGGAEGDAGTWIEHIDDGYGPVRKSAEDPRVTDAFARFCRRHSIDELPQLWHVVTGEMSLVGPRPMTSEELRRYYQDDAGEILQVKPGIAGLWQVSGRNRLTYRERLALDLKMVRELDPQMYFSILLRVIPEVISGRNTW